MDAQPMIDRYLAMRGHRIYRADDGERLIEMTSTAGTFRVYLDVSRAASNVLTIRARSSAQYSAAERTRLLETVNRWNDRHHWLPASVRDGRSSRLRVVGNGRFSITDETDFGAFARYADLAIAFAAKLFERVDAEMRLPSANQLEQWFAWEA